MQGPITTDPIVRRHLRIGWTALAIFVLLGMALEGMHAFKIGEYLNVANTTRRFMWTLAHAHGTLLGLVNLAFAAFVDRTKLAGRPLELVSAAMAASTALLPGGFFLGGLRFHGGDPGIGVLLVPIGGALLAISLIAVAVTTR